MNDRRAAFETGACMFITDDSLFGVIDVETTGFNPETDRIVEAAIVITDSNRNHDSTGRLCDPKMSIPPSASAVHHIVDADVQGRGEFRTEWFEDLSSDHSSDHDFLAYAAHFAEFERGFLKLQKPIICTLRLAKKLWPTLESWSNQYLRYYFKLEGCEGAVPHRALGDAIVTAALLRYELRELKSKRNGVPIDIDSLMMWIEEPFLLETVSFGKHKGKRWEDVPKDYLRWMVASMRDPEPDRDTLHTAKYYRNG